MKQALIVLSCALAGCSPSIPTSAVVDNAPVVVTPTGPEIGKGGERVFGRSCKRAIWDESPSAAAAIAYMKGEAFRRGFNAVHSITTEPTGGAMFINCWSAISASGIAYRIGPAQTK